MRMFSKLLVATLMSTAIFSSCSRPVAYFQPTAREQFKSAKTDVLATAAETPQPALVQEAAPAILNQEVAAPQQISQAKQTISELEAYVKNDNTLASNKKLAKRMSRVNELLSTSKAQTALSTKVGSTQKTTLIQRVMLKQLDKKIKNHLSPEKTMAKSVLTIGLIVAIIGLILLLLNVATPLGLIALIVGLALVLVDLLR